MFEILRVVVPGWCGIGLPVALFALGPGLGRPGLGQIHRACAQICIEGGEEIHVLLTTRMDGSVNELVLPFVAEPIANRGELREQAGLTVLRFDPEDMERP